MGDDRETRIRNAERARLEALVDEYGTDREEMQLLGSSGVTVVMLDAALSGPMAMRGMEPNHPPDLETLESVCARIRRRRQLALPHRDCLKRNCTCGALTDTLDAAAEDATKDEIARAARALHRDRNPAFAPPPIPPVQAEPPLAPERPTTPPAPIPAAVVNQTNTRPARIVRRRRKWFDDDRGAGGTTVIESGR
jgi:hypothetical protein